MLEGLLARQLSRIKGRFLLHGSGGFLVALTLAATVYYPLDRYLRLPAGVRIVLSLAALAYLAYLFHRFILYPIKHALTHGDVALATEDRFPELRQKLISAFQLGKTLEESGDADDLRNQSREMIEALLADAAQHTDRIRHQELLDPTRTKKVWAAAAVMLVLVGGFTATHLEVAGVFLQRIFGINAVYPRETTIVIERPSQAEDSGPDYRVVRDGQKIDVTLSAGGDLPVLARADGVVPSEVLLHVQGGRGIPAKVTMSARENNRFRHTFRRVSDGFSFWATGGDDYGSDALVEVSVVHPPKIETVRATITSPAYTRIEPTVQEGGAIEALLGSSVQFDITTTAEVDTATVKFLESGQELALVPVEVEDDGGRRTVYQGRFSVTESDHYQVELVGLEGLRNPHPGSYAIVALPDHPPVGDLLSPLDDNLNIILPDAMVPVRISARDDYGLTEIKLSLQSAQAEQGTEISLFEGAPDEPVTQQMAMTLIDLLQPEFKDQATVGQSLVLTIHVSDNRNPESQVKDVGPRQLRIIGETELLRTIARHFRNIRDDVEVNLALLKDRNKRLEDVIDDLGQEVPLKDLQLNITSVEVSQGRIKTAAGNIHRELMRAFNFHLFNRLETSAHAATVLERFVAFHESATEPRPLYPGFYRGLTAARRSGELGALEKALDPILEMTHSADQISETLAPDALQLLAKSRVAKNTADAAADLRVASEHQRKMMEEFEALLGHLDNWNEYQDVINSTRTLLDSQKEVRDRTIKKIKIK